MNAEKILVVDDEEAIREVVSTLLDAQGYACTVRANGRLALEAFRNDTFDLVLSDIVMPEMDGLKLLTELRAEDPDVPVIMVTAMHDISIALEAIRAGAYDYILKPFEKDQLHLSVRRALEHRRLVMDNRTYQNDLEMLVAERTLLNFMTHLSGIASATHEWSRALEGTNCRVRDTRKTTPGLRQLEKYAVRCGGGVNHRMGLGDAALIKDNHVSAAGSITKAIEDVRRQYPDVTLEVECDTLEQVREALVTGCSLILLDNMNVQQLRAAAELADDFPDVLLEASGGLTLEDATLVASTGVDYLAVGALTHSVRALDLGLDLI